MLRALRHPSLAPYAIALAACLLWACGDDAPSHVGDGGEGGGGGSGSAGGGGQGGGGPLGDGGADETCDVGVYDPANPPASLPLTGSTINVHDPVVIEAHGQFYGFSTGDHINANLSPDLLSWSWQTAPFGNQGQGRPDWLEENVPGVSNLWAPDISYFGGSYHLYYSASTFGSNRSCIGHLKRAALNAGSFSEEGPVICSNVEPGDNHNWNAIDPNVIVDEEGTPWMSFGSFWSGIKMIELDQDGGRANDDLHSIAARPSAGGALEAPFIIRRCDHYYLFTSWGSCCQGVNSTYEIRVGRSTNVLGPYVDRDGVALLEGGGTLVLEGNERWRGPGHNAVLISGTNAYNIYHTYDANNDGAITFRIAELVWDDEGWPISGGP